jgi:hypothetical protein
VNLADRSTYRHPGQLFLARFPWSGLEQSVLAYGAFLRREAGVGDQPPIELGPIYQHFGMPQPRRVPLIDQQGILVDGSSGIVLIKEDDPIVRQRFTEGHELMELLFDAQEQQFFNQSSVLWNHDEKERWCDRGAAALLMPGASFVPLLNQLGMSLPTGRALAQRYRMSLLATLVQMIQHTTGSYALVMWHLAHSQRDLAAGVASTQEQPQKLRVWWGSWSTHWQGGFIPRNKSIAESSLITKAYTTGENQIGREKIKLVGEAIPVQLEAMPISVGSKRGVLSLLHY